MYPSAITGVLMPDRVQALDKIATLKGRQNSSVM